MKEETKSKLKKYGKRAGLGLGFLALFLLGVGVGACSVRKAVGSSAQGQEVANLLPRYAINEEDNLISRGNLYDGVRVDIGSGDGSLYSLSNWKTWVVSRSYVPAGFSYVITYDGTMGNYASTSVSFVNGVSNAIVQHIQNGNFGNYSSSLFKKANIVTSNMVSPFVFSLPADFYVDGEQGAGNIHNLSVSLPNGATGVYLLEENYYLNNADGVDVTFSDKWIPYGLFTNRSSGDLGIVSNNFGNAQSTQNTLLRASFSDLLFTCGDGFGYDSIRVTSRPLWNGAKYINENGEVVTYSFSEQNEFIPLVVNYIDYRRFDTQNWVRVADYSLVISSDGSDIAINPRLSWASPLYMSPRFFRYPSGFVYPNWEVSTNIGSSWSYWNRVNPPAGLTFFDWFTFTPEDVHITQMDGFGGVFTLISSGFTSVMPLLNVQILPFLTLGMLLFAPVVVVLIVAIIKLLAK